MSDQAALEQLAGRLWDERRIVTSLLFKLTVTRLLLVADERRFVPDTLREVERAVELLHESGWQREEAVRELASPWQSVPLEPTLQELAHRAPAPFDHTFLDDLATFRQLAAEIVAATEDSRALSHTEFAYLTEPIGQQTGGTTAGGISDKELARANVTAEDSLGPAGADNLLSILNGIESSTVQDVHIEQGTMELQSQQIAYEPIGWTLTKALPPSLVAFLR